MQESNYHQYRGNPNNRLPALPAPYLPVPAGDVVVEAAPPAPRPEYGRLVRKYIVLGILLLLMGGGAGFLSVAFFAPMYKARTVIEIQSASDGFLKTRQDGGEDAININIQTQIQILKSVSFLRRVVSRLQLETVPPAPVQSDIFAKLRNRLKTVSQDPMAGLRDGLETAAAIAMGVVELGNLLVHLQLSGMRKEDGETTRNVPKGPLFALVSCPNYTFEVLSWVAFSLGTNIAMSWVFTAVGLAQMTDWALKKHRGYIKADPANKKKKAIIPFVI